MFGLKIFVRVQTFRRGPPHNYCQPGLRQIILLKYLIFMCTSTQQWQLRFYLWPCLFFFTSLVFETFTILFPHETCIENIRTRRGEELKMLKTANTVSMFSSAFCMPGRRGSCCSLTVTSSLPTRALTQGLQTLEMCCALNWFACIMYARYVLSTRPMIAMYYVQLGLESCEPIPAFSNLRGDSMIAPSPIHAMPAQFQFHSASDNFQQ